MFWFYVFWFFFFLFVQHNFYESRAIISMWQHEGHSFLGEWMSDTVANDEQIHVGALVCAWSFTQHFINIIPVIRHNTHVQ